MMEIPETYTISKQLKKEILNKQIKDVATNTSPHKFAFFYGDPLNYKKNIVGKKVTNIIERAFYIEIEVDDYTLLFRDGTNIRYYSDRNKIPTKHQLLIEFTDETFLVVTIAMYGFISCFKSDEYSDKYYEKEKNGVSPLSQSFDIVYFNTLLNESTKKLSAKAFLATEQRILGVGNGVLQDILFNAKINPKQKMNRLNDSECEKLFDSIKITLLEMANKGGRDTESNLYGEIGGYVTKMSKKTANAPCLDCNSIIKKESYMGGSIYYCPNCQKEK